MIKIKVKERLNPWKMNPVKHVFWYYLVVHPRTFWGPQT